MSMTKPIEALRATVHFDAGGDGRILVADSLTYFSEAAGPNDVVCGASFAGAPTGAYPLRDGAKGWIAHEGGPGRDEAGIGGLPLSDRFGVPAAAIATMTARLGDGRSLLTGTVSRANRAAAALGVEPGQSGEEAAKRMLKAPAGGKRDLAGLIDERVHVVHSGPAGKVFAVWSFSKLDRPHPDDVFCVASHGAKTMAIYALPIRPRGLICNDGGRGLDDSGVEGLWAMQDVGIPAATVASDSARIGDPLSTYNDGIVSEANDLAKAKGVRIGMPAREAAAALLTA